eukprot:695051-Rhodomonas_salina.4
MGAEIAVEVANASEGPARDDPDVQKTEYGSSKVAFAGLPQIPAVDGEPNGQEQNGNGAKTDADEEQPPAWSKSMKELLGQ